MTTCATVNAELKRRGYTERLIRNPRGPYYYWVGNDALGSTIVDGVSHLGAFTVEEIIDDLHRKRSDASKWRWAVEAAERVRRRRTRQGW
ncbi:MAG: hypothetical protein VW405_21180 [Rhodospirillaceae bacterium]|jgi:hypothetical protein